MSIDLSIVKKITSLLPDDPRERVRICMFVLAAIAVRERMRDEDIWDINLRPLLEDMRGVARSVEN